MKHYLIGVLCVVGHINAMEQSLEKLLSKPSSEFETRRDLVFKKVENQTNIMELWKDEKIDPVYNGFKHLLSPYSEIYHYKTESLAGGLTNATYICAVNDRKYVARIFKKEPSDEQCNGVLINLLVANKALAPKIHYSQMDDEASFIIMDFIDSPTLSFEQANRPEVIDLIAQKVRTIAQVCTDIPTNNKENLFAEINRHYNSIKSKNFSVLDFILEEMKNKAEKLHQIIENEQRPLVINHNDFHPRNIFFTNNDIKIIDWDTISANYEFFDLAGYSLFACLNASDDYYLLTKYLKDVPTACDIQYFNNVKLLGKICFVLSCFDVIESVPTCVSLESIKDFKYYATAFAQDANSDSNEFFYEFGMSQLREFRKEYEEFERQ